MSTNAAVGINESPVSGIPVHPVGTHPVMQAESQLGWDVERGLVALPLAGLQPCCHRRRTDIQVTDAHDIHLQAGLVVVEHGHGDGLEAHFEHVRKRLQGVEGRHSAWRHCSQRLVLPDRGDSGPAELLPLTYQLFLHLPRSCSVQIFLDLGLLGALLSGIVIGLRSGRCP